MATGVLGAVDFSGDPPDYAAVLRDRPRFTFCKYVSHTTWKTWTAGEIRTVLDHKGRAVLLVESTAARAIETSNDYAAGYADALAAIDQARTLLAGVKLAKPTPLIFAVDLDVPKSRLPEVGQYFKGVAAGFAQRKAHEFLVGGYGSIRVVKYLRKNRLAAVLFLTYAWLNGYLPTSRSADLYQYQNGQRWYAGTVDFCQINNIGNLSPITAPDDPLNNLDLMEVISLMDGAPSTYQKFLDDIDALVEKRANAARDGVLAAIRRWLDGHKLRTLFSAYFRAYISDEPKDPRPLQELTADEPNPKPN